MRPPHRIFLALYPKKWRDRYGSELEALLEDVEPGGRDLADLAWGGIKMQMTNWEFAKFIAAFAIVGLIAGGITSLMVKNTYMSSAVLRLTGDPDAFAKAETNVLSMASLSSMIYNEDLYHEERMREPLRDVIERMRTRDIHIAAKRGESNAFQVSYSTTDPLKAQAVTRLLIERLILIDERLILIERLSNNVPASPGQNLEVLDPPQFPKQPVAPNRVLIAFLGLAGGVIVGLIIAACGSCAAKRSSMLPDSAWPEC